ncbi:hypothetical protein [Caulobacter sp. 17J80-11]|uniref:hypothetical protein n=1 Tax=Caulobacter sp. 17J80-11 TaxID=2763502 RepID=UPI0016535ED8|nr:hypothetical protein [Caulobacter sp. 17J80-11]MBC6982025.1 hypothetical protein [Caulobacter sp. 17J80-11]
MAWKSDYESERTWEPNERLELSVVEHMRHAATYRITRKGLSYIGFLASQTGMRPLSALERLLNPGIQEHVTWHVASCSGDLPKQKLHKTVADALKAYQVSHGVPKVRAGKKARALVTVKFGSHPRIEP